MFVWYPGSSSDWSDRQLCPFREILPINLSAATGPRQGQGGRNWRRVGHGLDLHENMERPARVLDGILVVKWHTYLDTSSDQRIIRNIPDSGIQCSQPGVDFTFARLRIPFCALMLFSSLACQIHVLARNNINENN